jgi:ABC-type antimicrobial peptide transport system permease subunit
VVNRAFARALGESPEILKDELSLLSSRGRVVGIVDDFVGPVPGAPDSPRIFVPLGDARASVLLVRLRGDQPGALAAVRTIVSEIWGPSIGTRLTPVSDDAAALAVPWRARTILLGLIAALGVPLVVAGLIGSLYASVRRRTRDIAIHMALGATTREVSRLVVWRALAHTGAGVAVGLAAAMAVGRVLSGLLFDVTPADPATLAGVGVLMVSVAAVASLLPARLAASIAPIEALRER